MMNKKYSFTSESVTEGHPDKICDGIADKILDAYLEKDPYTRINIESLAKGNLVVLSGEISSSAEINHELLVRNAIKDIGYTDPESLFNYKDIKIIQAITTQASEIDAGVSKEQNQNGRQGAGDQGMMFGYATTETVELMPLPITLAHKLTKGLSEHRKQKKVDWLRPDGKSQVTVEYENDLPIRISHIVLSTQHSESISRQEIENYVRDVLAPECLGDWFNNDIVYHVNPTGSFIKGGPEVDSGLTGRKIIVDTYGGVAAHGGGSFSGKDPSKVDRSGAYFSRYVANQIIREGLSNKVEIQVSYAIGESEPISIRVNSFNNNHDQQIQNFISNYDFRPDAIIERLGLLNPLYAMTTNYGHFGKRGLPWEE